MFGIKRGFYFILNFLKFQAYPCLVFVTCIFLSVTANNNSSKTKNQKSNFVEFSSNITYASEDQMVVEKQPLFPVDPFTLEERRNGAVLFHISGVIYMFIALAIVCEDFFVPSLEVIIEKLVIQDDVAGATFMAAGGSAPELFTSVIGVFVSFDDVGIGTIVGSAVFNILFVIAMCTLFSKTVLTLTWWPLFRDCSFYSGSLISLILFFRDNVIHWYEALVMFLLYVAYVGFMKWNQQIEHFVKSRLLNKKGMTKVCSTDHLVHPNNAMGRASEISCTNNVVSDNMASTSTSSAAAIASNSSGHNASMHHGKFRHGLLQLMIHTIDPLHDGKVDEKATQLHAMASLKVLLDATKPHNGTTTSKVMQTATRPTTSSKKDSTTTTTIMAELPNGAVVNNIPLDNNLDGLDGNIENEVNISVFKRCKNLCTCLFLWPIVFPLWLTLPDPKTDSGKRFFAITFIGSILWIAVYSYLMVWWANVVGETISCPPEVMGLTFLAAGTSIPDLITSVIVARKGFGDMAVSSSVGSNIFDVTVGLPVPWLLYCIIYGKPVEVNSVGMVCSITILFMMLLFVIISIACFNWKMNKSLGATMFVLYFIFVAISLMFEYVNQNFEHYLDHAFQTRSSISSNNSNSNN